MFTEQMLRLTEGAEDRRVGGSEPRPQGFSRRLKFKKREVLGTRLGGSNLSRSCMVELIY